MKIYLVRHGESFPIGDDDQRPLSTKGKSDIEKLARFFSPLKLQVSQILHSKKYRAQQTAEILALSISATKPMNVRHELDPLASIIPIIEEINAQQHDVMLVGHMPFMGRLASKLIAGNENRNLVSMTTGTICCLELVNSEVWVMRWMLNPELFI